MRECNHCGFPHHFVGDLSYRCDNCGQHNHAKTMSEKLDEPFYTPVDGPLPGLDEIEAEPIIGKQEGRR